MRGKMGRTQKFQFASYSVLRRPGGFQRRDKTRSHSELGRQTRPRRWYYVSRPGRVGRCQACQARNVSLQDVDLAGLPVSGAQFGAGWSSPVARQAHNLKVTGSNPVPATNAFIVTGFQPASAGFFAFSRTVRWAARTAAVALWIEASSGPFRPERPEPHTLGGNGVPRHLLSCESKSVAQEK